MATKKPSKEPKRKSGPEPLKVKFEGSFDQAMDKVLSKKKPTNGWPKPSKR
jgi:hypothetical protein